MRRQLGYIIKEYRRVRFFEDGDPSSYVWLSRVFADLLSVESVNGSIYTALKLLQDVLNGGSKYVIDISFLEQFIKHLIAEQMGDIFHSFKGISHLLRVILKKPVSSDKDALKIALFMWVLKVTHKPKDGGDIGHTALTSIPSWGLLKGELIPSITFLLKRTFALLQEADVAIPVQYALLDSFLLLMLGLKQNDFSNVPVGQIQVALSRMLEKVPKEDIVLDSETKCSLVCFWHHQHAKAEFGKGDPGIPEFNIWMNAFLASVTPVLALSDSELALTSSWCSQSNIDYGMTLEKCNAQHRPYLSALYTIEHANAVCVPLDHSQMVLRILSYEEILKDLGKQYIFKDFKKYMQNRIRNRIHKDVFSHKHKHSNIIHSLSKLVCLLLDYTIERKGLPDSQHKSIIDMVKLVLEECVQLLWNKACCVRVMQLWYKKGDDKFFNWWFDKLAHEIHSETIISMLCMALYSESDYLFAREDTDKEKVEHHMYDFRENLMKKVFGSFSLNTKLNNRGIQLIMHALSFDRVQIVNQMKSVSNLSSSSGVKEIHKEVQQILAYDGINANLHMNLAYASGNLIALPLVCELSECVIEGVTKSDEIEREDEVDLDFFHPSVATCLTKHLPWSQKVKRRCVKKENELMHIENFEHWRVILENNYLTSGLDRAYLFSVFARLIRSFCGEIEAWKDNILDISKVASMFQFCIRFCLDDHKEFPMPSELLRNSLGRATLIWLDLESGVLPCTCFGILDALDASGKEKTFWGKSLFQRATIVSKSDVFTLSMKLIEFDYKHATLWQKPLGQGLKDFSPIDTPAKAIFRSIWKWYPSLAQKIYLSYPQTNENELCLAKLVMTYCNEPVVQKCPEFAELMMKYSSEFPTNMPFHALDHWEAHESFVPLLKYTHPCLDNYLLQCVEEAQDTKLRFMLPQMVQSLRYTNNRDLVQQILKIAAGKDEIFLLYLIWNLEGEKSPPKEAFNPVIKRSGWKPPTDTGLWKPAEETSERIVSTLSPARKEKMQNLLSYFERINDLSGYLGSVENEKRIHELQKKAEQIPPPPADVFIPFDVDQKIDGIQANKCITLPSAAKIPILVNFDTTFEKKGKSSMGCIFKVGDDCRQDVLALQIVTVLKDVFSKNNLELFLYPYGVIPSGYERGIIEVVPNTRSRSGLGEMSDCGLLEIFETKFGSPGSETFESARMNFIRSCAGYAVASYLLWAKDRHNGNILLDKMGHLIHIDFGFILGISPGGNLGFENAGFKLSHEMCQLIDPLGNRKSKEYLYFKRLCIRGYLAARKKSDLIINIVTMMSKSGLPCFGYGKPLETLRNRLTPDCCETKAAALFEQVVDDAYMKWTTGFYDVIQFLQQGIPK